MNTPANKALKAVLLFHSSGPWTQEKRTEWWNATQTNEATTRNLCDTVRLTLGLLPSCFGDFAGRPPCDLPPDMPLSAEQRVAIQRLEENSPCNNRQPDIQDNRGPAKTI